MMYDQLLTSTFMPKVLMATTISTMIFIAIASYIYTSLAWMTIARKLKHPYPWLAWIPIGNIALVLSLGGFHWVWAFIVIIPVIGWIALGIMAIISMWRIYEQRKYPGWFALAMLLPQIGWMLNMIILGFVAWGDRRKKLL